MPEIKNTFLKSKMNKDLDARLIPNGEYRDGQNISVSSSEGSDVGSLENIRGNVKITDFNLIGKNLDIIGHCEDSANNRIYFFITNFSDSSIDSLSNQSETSETVTLNGVTHVREGSKHYICYCEIPSFQTTFDVNAVNYKTLVSGNFLNFSKTHPILGVSLLENLLFWTDNRNQPRKINVDKAIGNENYYKTEDNISVAKYAPFSPIGFLKNTSGVTESTLINEKDEWLPAFFGLPGKIHDRNAGTPPVDDVLLFGNSTTRLTDYLPTGTPSYDIRIISAKSTQSGEALVKTITADSSGDFLTIKTLSTPPADIPDISTTLGWEDGTFLFQLRNPNYNSNFAGDKSLLESKFVRFSYRFKYDENDYSLTAPFSQHAFVPKQFGYFIGIDDDKTRESSIVDFMENQVTTVGLVIDLPYSPSDISDKLKVEEIQLLYKASDEETLKVIKDLKIKDISGSVSTVSIESAGNNYGIGTFTNISLVGGNGSGAKASVVVNGSGRISLVTITSQGEGYLPTDELTVPSLGGPPSGSGGVVKVLLSNTIIYNYSSEKPVKVLSEKEIVRVSDIVPLRAATQEIVGNRVIYGNFLQNNKTPDSLRYSIEKTNKGSNSPDNKKEFLNHSLKQNRSYQAGIVLQDRYGRASNIILSENKSTFNSSFYSDYSNGGVDPLTWGGDSLRIIFDELIPTEKRKDYNGVWDSELNPLGWYSYKIVVKQQEQDYYNIYTAGNVSGDFVFNKYETPIAYTSVDSISQIALFNDNINKIPRDLKEVGPSDSIYSSSTILYNRVKQTHRGGDYSPVVQNIGEQNRNPNKIEIINVKPFRELGEWTTKKNVDMHYFSMDPDPLASPRSQYLINTFIYPGYEGTVDPFYMKNNKNPLIATIKTSKRLGYKSGSQSIKLDGEDDLFAKKLNVFETKPFKSNLEIYYETSTSGLISEFNSNVVSGFGSPAPGGLTDINIEFPESTTVPTDISNTFQIVDTQNQILNNVTCEVLIDEVFVISANGQTTPVVHPVVIQEVQQPSLPSTPATYKLVNSVPKIYNSLSDQDDRYLIEFRLKVNGFADIIVEKEFNLTNLKPSIYKVIDATLNFNYSGLYDSGNPDFWMNRNFMEQDGLQEFLDSSKTSPLNNVSNSQYYNNPYNGVTKYIVKSQDIVNEAIQGVQPGIYPGGYYNFEIPGAGITQGAADYYSNVDLCYFGMVSNGSSLITTFDETTDARLVNQASIIGTKDEGLIYRIKKATEYLGQYYPDDDALYCYDDTPVNKTNNFSIRAITVGPTIPNDTNTRVGGDYYTLRFDIGSNTLQNKDFKAPNDGPTSWRGAIVYYIELEIIDASSGPGSITSVPYSVKFVIYNDFL
jgi:hypothetical protein